MKQKRSGMEELLWRYVQGSVTDEDKRQLLDWLDERPENMREYLALRKLYDISLWNRNTPTVDPAVARRRPWRQAIGRIAFEALKIAAVLLVGWFGARSLVTDREAGLQPGRMQTIRVPAGQRVEVILADGTAVWLNSRSTLTFPERFSTGDREVELDGEGYFSVAPDRQRPFIVKTGKYDVRVLGTEFNVKAYRSSEWFETDLLKGSVEIIQPGTTRTIRLQPNERAEWRAGQWRKTAIPNPLYFKWKEGVFCFENETVESLIEKLQLYYDIRIEVRRPSLLGHHYSGKFRIKDGIEHVLKVLQLEHGFTYTKDDELNLIVIR